METIRISEKSFILFLLINVLKSFIIETIKGENMQRYDYLKVRAYKKDDYNEIRDFHEGFVIVKNNNQYFL